MEVLESPGKVLDFFVSKRVGTLFFAFMLLKVILPVSFALTFLNSSLLQTWLNLK